MYPASLSQKVTMINMDDGENVTDQKEISHVEHVSH